MKIGAQTPKQSRHFLCNLRIYIKHFKESNLYMVFMYRKDYTFSLWVLTIKDNHKFPVVK